MVFQFLIYIFWICFPNCDDKICARVGFFETTCFQVGFVFFKKLRVLSFRVLLKSNNITFSYASKYIWTLLDINTDFICSGGLYALTISLFLKHKFITRKRVSLSSLREFSCFTGIPLLSCIRRPPPKLFPLCLNILYHPNGSAVWMGIVSFSFWFFW